MWCITVISMYFKSYLCKSMEMSFMYTHSHKPETHTHRRDEGVEKQ